MLSPALPALSPHQHASMHCTVSLKKKKTTIPWLYLDLSQKRSTDSQLKQERQTSWQNSVFSKYCCTRMKNAFFSFEVLEGTFVQSIIGGGRLSMKN